jgi:23S rRNA pseudouridine1911/1915/1917 synthase
MPGVSLKTLSVKPADDGMALQDFLARHLRLSRNAAKRLLDQRGVFVNARRVWMAHHRLRAGDGVEVAAAPSGAAGRTARPKLLYEDEHFAVVDKPPGTIANGPGSIEEDLRTALGAPDLAAAHRLDRDTSGCLLLAKSRDAFERAVGCFRDQRVRKIYHAIVLGPMKREDLKIEAPIDRQEAVTLVRVLDTNARASHLSVKIETGRTHQIRKHLAGIAHPVLGDREHGASLQLDPDLRAVGRQMLHARRLEFASPFGGATIRCEAPLPADFAACLRRLRLT